MREIRKRLKQLEANRRVERPCSASLLAAIEEAALGKMSAVDRELFQSKTSEGLEHTQAYQDRLTRREAAFAAASWEFGVPYFDPVDRGWL